LTGQSSALTIENVNPDVVNSGQRGPIDRDGRSSSMSSAARAIDRGILASTWNAMS